MQNGDQIDILSSQNQKPKQDWLDIVITSKAKSRIKAALNPKNSQVAEGKEIFQKKIKTRKTYFSEEEVNNIQKFFNHKTSQDLFLKFYDGTYDTTDLKKYADSKSAKNFFQRFRKSSNINTALEESPTSDLDLIVFGKDEEKLNYSFAKCCTVIPGDKILDLSRFQTELKFIMTIVPMRLTLEPITIIELCLQNGLMNNVTAAE